MRGGISMEDLLHVYSFEDRDMLNAIIKENVEATIESRMPLL
jgi:hypothetical protein